ncbi:hypothetical protein ACMT4L_03105 [Deinococcus sp. A31D244]|uniref:hypothetical protein n=1 Tax=Deinococcus sp. A31D244 TaxID=3397675 RepID=UPI0039E0C89D
MTHPHPIRNTTPLPHADLTSGQVLGTARPDGQPGFQLRGVTGGLLDIRLDDAALRSLDGQSSVTLHEERGGRLCLLGTATRQAGSRGVWKGTLVRGSAGPVTAAPLGVNPNIRSSWTN